MCVMRTLADSPMRSSRGMPAWVFVLLLVILFSYVTVDIFVYHSRPSLPPCVCNCPSAAVTTWKELDYAERKAKACTSRDDHYEVDGSYSTREDPWQQIKWIGQAAACPVKGHLIEKLDDLNNFRRGFALKFADDVEDKTHVLPWLLASRVDLNRNKRRVYLDLGANRFVSSVLWFLRMYPCDFTEIHAFEARPRSWRAPKKGFEEQFNLVEANNSIRVKQKPGIPQWMLDRISVHFKIVANEDDEGKGVIDISRFIKDELMLKPTDTVVVKMDIEGNEWPILRRWIEDPDMPHIVDELFVEVHYAHPSMSAFDWNNFMPTTREDAKRLLADLRWRGFYVHAWP